MIYILSALMTNWTIRNEVQTNWEWRKRPILYLAPLEWVNWIVHDEDNKIIYIYADEWKEVPATKWTPRPILND